MATELASPNFEQLANLLIVEGAFVYSPSELHGVIVGQIAAGQRFDEASLAAFCIRQLDIEGLVQIDSSTKLNLLYSGALKQLESSSFELALLLPDDEHSLAQRAEQLRKRSICPFSRLRYLLRLRTDEGEVPSSRALQVICSPIQHSSARMARGRQQGEGHHLLGLCHGD